MSDLLNIATVALVGLVQASLQLNLGGLVLLYHASMGKHRRRKTRYLAKSYIWGAMAINFLAVCSCCFLLNRLFGSGMTSFWLVMSIGVMFACGIIMWALYYRGNRGTELWLPRSFARYIRKKSRSTSDDISAFSLGMLSSFAEMPLSLVLYVVAGNAILQTSTNYQILLAVGYTLLTAAPMVILKMRMKTGESVVAAQRWRVANKSFLRIISGTGFMVLSAFMLMFWVM